MSLVYLYAVLGDRPGATAGCGLRGESLRVVECGDVLAAVGDIEQPPPIDAATMRAHDAVVRRLAGLVDAILPARFGSSADETTLAEAIAARAAPLRAGLALVQGREQMTLRVYGATEAAPAEIADDVGGGPGSRYLARRLRRVQAERHLPEIAPVSRAVDPIVHATRVRRHATPPLVATVYHLIGREQSATYLARVDGARGELRGVQVVASGPAPPYAFAAGAEL